MKKEEVLEWQSVYDNHYDEQYKAEYNRLLKLEVDDVEADLIATQFAETNAQAMADKTIKKNRKKN